MSTDRPRRPTLQRFFSADRIPRTSSLFSSLRKIASRDPQVSPYPVYPAPRVSFASALSPKRASSCHDAEDAIEIDTHAIDEIIGGTSLSKKLLLRRSSRTNPANAKDRLLKGRPIKYTKQEIQAQYETTGEAILPTDTCEVQKQKIRAMVEARQRKQDFRHSTDSIPFMPSTPDRWHFPPSSRTDIFQTPHLSPTPSSPRWSAPSTGYPYPLTSTALVWHNLGLGPPAGQYEPGPENVQPRTQAATPRASNYEGRIPLPPERNTLNRPNRRPPPPLRSRTLPAARNSYHNDIYDEGPPVDLQRFPLPPSTPILRRDRIIPADITPPIDPPILRGDRIIPADLLPPVIRPPSVVQPAQISLQGEPTDVDSNDHSHSTQTDVAQPETLPSSVDLPVLLDACISQAGTFGELASPDQGEELTQAPIEDDDETAEARDDEVIDQHEALINYLMGEDAAARYREFGLAGYE